MKMALPGLALILLFLCFSECGSCSRALASDPRRPGDEEVMSRPVESKDPHGDLEKDMKSLLEDLENLQKEAKEKMSKEILPRLRREMERIRKWLKEFRLEKGKEDRPETIRT